MDTTFRTLGKFEIKKNYFCFNFNLLEPTGYLMHQQVYRSKILYSTHILSTCFVFNSEKTAIFVLYNIK